MKEFYDAAFDALPTDIQAELRGITSAFPRVERDLLLVMNLFYELHTACTSAIARRSPDLMENLIHGRNLDIGYGVLIELERQLGRNVLRNMVININFRRGGEVVFKGTNVAGQIYPLEGLKWGKFSYSQNSREVNTDTATAIGNIIDWARGERRRK